MAFEGSEIERLILDAQRNLVPAPFPPRRDVEVAHAGSAECPDTILFHDVFWPRQDKVTCFVARLGGGTRGRLSAHVLRALLRTAVRTHPAGRALDLSLRAFREAGLALPLDAAIACLDARDGAATFGVCGDGMSLHLAGLDNREARDPREAARLAVGDLCWLSVGGARPDGGGPDVIDLVRGAVARRQDAAAAAMELRGLREPRGARVMLSNDVAEIVPALAEIEGYLACRAVRPESAAGLDVALDELLTNVVLYAYADGERHEITIDLRLDGPTLIVEIRDDGAPFDPTEAGPPRHLEAALQDRPIGGLGLHFVRTVFDRMKYRRVRGWNVLTLSKALAVAPAQEGPPGAPDPKHTTGAVP